MTGTAAVVLMGAMVLIAALSIAVSVFGWAVMAAALVGLMGLHITEGSWR